MEWRCCSTLSLQVIITPIVLFDEIIATTTTGEMMMLFPRLLLLAAHNPPPPRRGRDNEFNSLCRASPSSSLFLTVSFPGHGLLPDCLLESDHPTSSSSSSPSERKLCLLQRDKLSMIKSSLIWILNEICINFWGNPPVSSASRSPDS